MKSASYSGLVPQVRAPVFGANLGGWQNFNCHIPRFQNSHFHSSTNV
jgi:hypothetical protein